jgi:SpoVK/Ycf46/Vps4 family AAA+-type ATPase
MEELKALARLKIIQPFAQPELFKRYGRTAGGGMLMYGPPGCGKTHFARAVAGECSASFFNVGIHDILNLYVGNSERNVQRLFATARARRPAIVFIDELDALCRKRDLMRNSNLTGTINAFLAEMDGLGTDNANLLVIGATNAPWDIDPAFKRPGRFDPPDTAARGAILQLALAQCPTAPEVSVAHWAEQTAGFSGADLTALVERATGRVLDLVLQGQPERPVDNSDLGHALKATRPSSLEWMATARQYVEHANQSGDYDAIATYLSQAPGAKRPRFGFL